LYVSVFIDEFLEAGVDCAIFSLSRYSYAAADKLSTASFISFCSIACVALAIKEV